MAERDILVIAAHCDDEALGCGGTIAAHVAGGDRVHVLIFADGSTGVRGYEPNREWRSKQEILHSSRSGFHSPSFSNAHKSAAILGASSLRVLASPDSRFESIPIIDFAHYVEEALDRFQPEIVYTHHGGDLNMDHRWVHQAVVAATRPKPGSTVKQVLFWETPSSTEWAMGAFEPFRPTVFQPLSHDNLSIKLRALSEAYGVEMRDDGHPRSVGNINSLARYRGSQSGNLYAEAFMPGRIIR